jgi:hypothetical protein
VAIFDRQLVWQRKVWFHPEYDAALQRVIDQMPPRFSTLIGAAALYTRRTVPWNDQADGTRQVAVAGSPRENDYFYRLIRDAQSPDAPERFSGRFALTPVDGSTRATPAGVIGTLGGELLLDTYDIPALVNAAAAVLRECYGDLRSPWDAAPGAFNHHDQAILDRLQRQMPHFAATLDKYLQFSNVLDEFHGAAGPFVLYNLDVELRMSALAKYRRLRDFYRSAVSALAAHSAIRDAHGNDWMRASIERGHIRVTFMVQDGMLTPFNAALQPAGEGLALHDIESGGFRTVSSLQVSSLRMHFGLANIGFTTTYRHDPRDVMVESRMNAVPQLIAPPGLHQALDLVAGDFLRAVATGHGGMTSQVSSRQLPNGLYRFAARASAEFPYAPTLAFLTRIGDALAGQHDTEVRAEERALAEELFDAFVADYDDARAAIVALDGGASTSPSPASSAAPASASTIASGRNSPATPSPHSGSP